MVRYIDLLPPRNSWRSPVLLEILKVSVCRLQLVDLAANPLPQSIDDGAMICAVRLDKASKIGVSPL